MAETTRRTQCKTASGADILLGAQLIPAPLSLRLVLKTDGDNSGSPVTDVDGLLYAGCFTRVMEDRFNLYTTDDTLTVNVSVVAFFTGASK